MSRRAQGGGAVVVIGAAMIALLMVFSPTARDTGSSFTTYVTEQITQIIDGGGGDDPSSLGIGGNVTYGLRFHEIGGSFGCMAGTDPVNLTINHNQFNLTWSDLGSVDANDRNFDHANLTTGIGTVIIIESTFDSESVVYLDAFLYSEPGQRFKINVDLC